MRAELTKTENAIAEALEGHSIEWIDEEVGFACLCDEEGELVMPTQAEVAQHQARVAATALGINQDGEGTRPCGSAYLVHEGLTVWCGNGQTCNGNHRAYTGDAQWTEQDSSAEYLCPRCENWGAWTDGQSRATGQEVDEYWCQKCGKESPLAACSKRLRSAEETLR
jgi:predicted RNA-binding Zn-ribbon protein involved in translation (DUF1610 family)